jgi:hypothetical protein
MNNRAQRCTVGDQLRKELMKSRKDYGNRGSIQMKSFCYRNRELLLTVILSAAAILAAIYERGIRYSFKATLIVVGFLLSVRFILGILLLGNAIYKHNKITKKELLIILGSGVITFFIGWIWEINFIQIAKFSSFVALLLFVLTKTNLQGKMRRDH